MAFEDFPDDVSLRFRTHVLFVYAQSTLNLAAEIAAEGPDHLDDADRKLFADLTAGLESIWLEAAKLNAQVRRKGNE